MQNIMARRSVRRKLSFADNDIPQCCHLCLGHHVQTSQPSQWKSKKACAYISSLGVPVEATICKLCRDDITKVIDNPACTPRWKRMEEGNEPCIVNGCLADSFVSTKLLSTLDLPSLERNGLTVSGALPIPTPLCKSHYHKVYNIISPSQLNCATCGVSLKYSKPRLCAQPQVISKHLKETTGFDGTISHTDSVCYACYKTHWLILGGIKVSTDEDLTDLITTISENLTLQNGSMDSIIENAQCSKSAEGN